MSVRDNHDSPQTPFSKPKLRSLDPRARRRPRPRSVGVFSSEESPIVPQLFCPVSLIVKHRDSRGRRTTTSIQESRGFLGCDMNTLLARALSWLAGSWQEESKHGGRLGSYGRIRSWCEADPTTSMAPMNCGWVLGGSPSIPVAL